MGDENHSTLVLVERLRDDREVAEVDMIRWLVEDEESWLLEDEPNERNKSLLTFGEIADARLDDITRHEESCRCRA